MPRAGQPETFFLILRSVADGTLLASASGSCDHDPPAPGSCDDELSCDPSCAITLDRVDDHGCWRAEGNAAEDGCLLSNVARPELRLRCAFRGGGARAAADRRPAPVVASRSLARDALAAVRAGGLATVSRMRQRPRRTPRTDRGCDAQLA